MARPLINRDARTWRWISATLAVIAALGIALTTVAVWAQRSVLDDQRFADEISTAIDDDRVTDALATYLTAQVLDVVDVSAFVADLLPGERPRIEAAIAMAIEDLIGSQVNAVIGSDQFTTFFVRTVSAAHEAAMNLIDDTSAAVDVQDQEVVVDLVPVVAELLRRLGASGLIDQLAALPALNDEPSPGVVRARLAAVLDRQIPDDFGQITVMRADTLQDVQRLVRLIHRALWLLVIVTLVLAVVSLATARDRSRRVVQLALIVAVLDLLLVLGTRRIANRIVEVVADHTGNEGAPASRALVDVFANRLQLVLGISAVVAVIVAAVAQWVPFGPPASPEPAAAIPAEESPSPG